MESEKDSNEIRIEVAYALPHKQVLLALSVEPGTSVMDAIDRSGMRTEFPDIRIDPGKLGVFGRKIQPDHQLKDGDRIEIYRALIADPKEVRRERAKKAKS